MKISTSILFVFIAYVSINVKAYSPKQETKIFESAYEIHGDEMTDEELASYYKEYGIYPSDVSGYGGEMYEKSHVETYLKDNDPEGRTWLLDTDSIHNVSKVIGGNDPDIYKYNPNAVAQSFDYIEEAQALAGNTFSYIGCGPLAMINQFEFLGEKAGYTEIIPFAGNYELKKNLAQRIIETTQTYEISENAVFETPSDFISSANTILAYYGLNKPKTRVITDDEGNVTTETYYDQDSRIVVSGDVSLFTPSNLDDIMASIDKGMPVVWWTFEAGVFGSHYMNIYDYHYWTATDSDGNIDSHLFFKVCVNWPNGDNTAEPDYYVDSEFIKNCSCGFIYFEENPDYERIIINYDEISLGADYTDETPPFSINAGYFSNLGYTVSAKRASKNSYLTNSYAYGFNDEYLILSTATNNVNEAYIEFNFNEEVTGVNFYYFLYSSTELLDSTNGEILVQYKDHLGNWITLDELLEEGISTTPNAPTEAEYVFPYSITSFRIKMEYHDSITSTFNLGRLVISNMNFKVGHSHNWHYSVSQFTKTNHKRECSCGESKLEAHAVSSEYAGFSQAPCIVCGYMVNLGSDDKFFDNILSVREEYVTENGSYILPNGIIILVDEDYDDYILGKLRFYSKDQLII